MAASEGAPPAGRVRRGHRGRARAAAASTSRASSAILDRHGLDGRLLRPLLGRLPAHPPVPRPHRARRRRDDARGRRARSSTWSPSSTASTRPSTATGACAAPFNPRDLRRRALRGDARGQARCSTRDGRLNPGVMVDAAPLTAHLRDAALPAAAAARDPLRLRRGRDARAPPTAASASAPAARPAAASCARPTWPRARRSTPPAGAPTRSSRRCREPDPRGRAGRRAPARDPRPLPRVQGVQERVPAERRHGDAEGRVPLALPGRSTACRCARGCSARSGTLNRLGAATAPLSNLPVAARGCSSASRASTAGGRCRASRARR